MKCLILIVHFISALSIVAECQPTSFKAADIPEALKKNASVVKRLENISFEVQDIDEARMTVRQVYTVINETGRRALYFNEYSDKFRSLDDAEITVYNAEGKQTDHYKQKDMLVRASSDGLIDDVKETIFQVSTSSYPITVEYSYKIKYRGTLLYPFYYIQFPSESTEWSAFSVKVSKDLDIHFKERNTDLKPEIKDDGKFKIYNWKAANLPCLVYEEGAVGQFPYIMLAPNKFKFDDYAGDLTTWKSFGEWYAKLYKGLDNLPPERVRFFNDLVKNAKDDKDKVRIIYNYLQKNFRYVSIQLGIGGLRPFSAEFTDQKKYGDCKALSNFTMAALKAVGIKSYSAIINAGAYALPIDPDFPSKFSNHVILCVPMQKDTIWLECTSNTSDFGVLGNFTENRNALLVTENGGVLVSTPESRMEYNKYVSGGRINLEDDGSATSSHTIRVTGEFKDIFLNYLINEKEDNQKKFIVYNLDYKQPDDFKLRKMEEKNELSVTIDMVNEKVPEFMTGSKMFLAPRLFKLWTGKLPKSENRKQDFYFSHPFVQEDTTVYVLPKDFTGDAIPTPKKLECEFATYSSKIWYDSNQNAIISTAKLCLKERHIPAAGYARVKEFFDQVMMEDAQRIVIRKQ